MENKQSIGGFMRGRVEALLQVQAIAREYCLDNEEIVECLLHGISFKTELEGQDREVIDRKFRFQAFNPCKKKIYSHRDGVVFLAKDKALPATLKAYVRECEKLGADPSHLESLQLLMERVDRYQAEVESRVPDTESECEIARCIGGKL